MKLSEAVDVARFWLAMWESEIEANDGGAESDVDAEEKRAVRAMNTIMNNLREEEYVAWIRWNGTTYVTCDSDAEGAFRVYRAWVKQ